MKIISEKTKIELYFISRTKWIRMCSNNSSKCRLINNSNRYGKNFWFVYFHFVHILIGFLLVQLQQIQSSASTVGQTGNMPNMSTAGNMRNPAVTGNVNGNMMNQSGMQQTMNAAGMPFNSGNMSSMMNSSKYLFLFIFYFCW